MHAHVLFRHEIPSGVEYRLTTKGQELVESVITLLQWMKEGERIFVGSPTVIMNKSRKMIPHMIQQKINELESEGKTVVGIFLESELAGLIAVADVLREEAKEIIDVIKGSGKDIILMSGDNERTTHAIANELGLKNVLAHVLPEDKTHEIKKLQNQGRKVAMIGDGINDAPALTQADIGIAMGSGTDIAMSSGNIILVKSDLNHVHYALRIGMYAMKKIKQNLVMSFIYDAITISIAAGLLFNLTHSLILTPTLAALGWIISDSAVFGNSLLIRQKVLIHTSIREPRLGLLAAGTTSFQDTNLTTQHLVNLKTSFP